MSGDRLDFDAVLEYVGDFGRYQIVMYILLCLPASLPSAWTAFNQVFTAAVPVHWCELPADVGLNKSARADPHMLVADGWLLPIAAGEPHKRPRLDMCHWRNQTGDVHECQQWRFDRSTYQETLATEFTLVCDRAHWVSLSTMLFYMGSFIGNILFGYIADRWGRRVSFFSILCTQVLFGTLCAFAPTIWVFVVLRTVVGLSFPALYQIPFIVSMEMMGPERRIFSGILICMFFGLAMCLLSIVAWALRHWFWITIVSNLPFAVLFLYWFFLPESPRWLMIVDRTEEAEKTLAQIAHYNRRNVDPKELHSLVERLRRRIKADEEKQNRHNLADLFRTPNLRKKTIVITYIWFVNAVVYNGLTLNVANLPVNDYLSSLINGAVELPCYFLIWPLLDRVGRRWPLVVLMLFGGAACLCTLFVPSENVWTVSGLAFAGKFGIAGSFAVIYIFAGELYPTVIRALGMGMSSMVAGLGLILGPYLVQLGSVVDILPILIMGTMMVSAGAAAVLLPETLGAPLPQTLHDAETFGRRMTFWYWPPSHKEEVQRSRAASRASSPGPQRRHELHMQLLDHKTDDIDGHVQHDDQQQHRTMGTKDADFSLQVPVAV